MCGHVRAVAVERDGVSSSPWRRPADIEGDGPEPELPEIRLSVNESMHIK